MNSRKLVSMFFKTLFIGGLAGFVASFFVNWQDYSAYLSPFDGFNLLGVALFYLGYALVFTVIAQTGFFAYLFIHRFGQGFFKTFWPVVQVLLMLFALFDMIFFTSDDISALFKWSLVIIIGMTAYIVATIKVKQTKKTAFIPTMFLMIVVSALELSLVLRAGDVKFIILMLVPVLVANAYQILILHKVTAVDPEHQARIEARRKARREAKEKQAAEKRVKKKN
ncbi:MAG TPA: KinB-signaling pathway activation protein [Pseudogracilibacillus sp.]|nr:KinB-signaling pathway activation protein [Pseudogracilibacillus sp.]